MKKIVCFETRDGKIHKSEGAAKKHAEVTYGNALTKLAHNILREPKYVGLCEFLESKIIDGTFSELIALHKDTIVPKEDDETS